MSDYNISKEQAVDLINACDTEDAIKSIHDTLQESLNIKHSLWYSRGKVETRKKNALLWTDAFYSVGESPSVSVETPVEAPLETLDQSARAMLYYATKLSGDTLEFATKAELQARFPHPDLDVIINSSLVTQGYRIKDVK